MSILMWLMALGCLVAWRRTDDDDWWIVAHVWAVGSVIVAVLR